MKEWWGPHCRCRKSRSWCEWEFVRFQYEAAPPGLASLWELNCLCSCKQLVHVLCVKVWNTWYTFWGAFREYASFRKNEASSLSHILSSLVNLRSTVLECQNPQVAIYRIHNRASCLCIYKQIVIPSTVSTSSSIFLSFFASLSSKKKIRLVFGRSWEGMWLLLS